MIYYGFIRSLGCTCMGIPGNPPTLAPQEQPRKSINTGPPGTTQEIHQHWSQADPAFTPCLKIFRVYFWKFWPQNTPKLYCNQRAMLQCVLYSLLSLQQDRVGVKGHQNNLQTSKIIPRLDRAPVKKFLDPPLLVPYDQWWFRSIVWQLSLCKMFFFF